MVVADREVQLGADMADVAQVHMLLVRQEGERLTGMVDLATHQREHLLVVHPWPQGHWDTSAEEVDCTPQRRNPDCKRLQTDQGARHSQYAQQ